MLDMENHLISVNMVTCHLFFLVAFVGFHRSVKPFSWHP